MFNFLILSAVVATGYGLSLRADCGSPMEDEDHFRDELVYTCKNWEIMWWVTPNGYGFGASHLELECRENGQWGIKRDPEEDFFPPEEIEASVGFITLPMCDGSEYILPGGDTTDVGTGDTGESGAAGGTDKQCNKIESFNGGSGSTTTPNDCPYKPDGSGTEHTMCTYSSKSDDCDIKHNGLSQADKDKILHLHNVRRSEVAQGKAPNQPAAKNMLVMTWNNELEEIAQRWSDQCNGGHDQNRNLLDNPTAWVGQNAYMGMNSEKIQCAGVESAVDGWYSEVTYIDTEEKAANVVQGKPADVKEVIGHYTQLAWASSNELGCGLTVYSGTMCVKTSGCPVMDNCNMIQCNYNPGGNNGNEMYATEGDCPEGTTRMGEGDAYPGLCAPEKKREVVKSMKKKMIL